MDRTERLLDLVAFFLDAKDPVSLADVRRAFPEDYAGNEEASQRKFERDKAELLELGIPLQYSPGTSEQPPGYRLERDAYYLPESSLTPAELAVLSAAGSAALASGAFPGKDDLAYALRKITFFADDPLPAPHVRLELGTSNPRALAKHLDQLWTAIGARRFVLLDYFSPHARAVTSRRVDPYGLALRGGVWNLVGWCHLRNELRTFHVSRIRSLQVNESKTKSGDFEVPADFRLEAHVASWPWQHKFHAPIEVTLGLSTELAAVSKQLFGVESSGPFTLTVTHLDGLLTTVLSLGGGAKVLEPASARDRLRSLAEAIALAHETGSAS